MAAAAKLLMVGACTAYTEGWSRMRSLTACCSSSSSCCGLMWVVLWSQLLLHYTMIIGHLFVIWDAAHDLKLLVSAAASPSSFYRTVHHDDAYILMFNALARSTSAAAAAGSWLELAVDAPSSNKVSSQPSEAGAQAAGWRHSKVAAAVHDSEIPSSLQGRLTAVS